MSEAQSDTQHSHNHDHQAVACDGGGGALGHPKVYLDLHNGKATCPYCSKEFTSADIQ